MSFIDTSVIVRYLISDVPELAEKARVIVESSSELLVADVVLVEVAFVLRSVYKMPREELIDTLVLFVQRHNVVVFGFDKELVVKGLLLCRPSGRVSLPDAFLWVAALSGETGNGLVYTFDQRFPADGIRVRAEL